MVSPARKCNKWQSNDAQITGRHTWHTSYSFPKNAWYLLMKLVVLQKTRLENLVTLFEEKKPFAIGTLLVGRVSAITAISSDGLLGVELTTGTNSADNFADFVRGTLVPNMQPFNGHSERSVAVMDNCSIHHVHLVMEIFRGAGILVIFLPPYSPDYNPIELTFSSIKSYLKDHDTLLENLPVRDAMKIILAAFDSITPQKCDAWIRHCGYE